MDGPEHPAPTSAAAHVAEVSFDAEVRRDTNAILDTVVLMVTNVLRGQGFPLRAPVVARFRDRPDGNTGVEVSVHLEDPRQAGAAKTAILQRFPDHLSEVMVS